jgi:cytoskeletal protein CcmA (bactofilin family)
VEPVRVDAADIGGELVATLQAAGAVRLRSTARFFGTIQAPGLIVESGAVFVGTARVGPVVGGASTGARRGSPVR